MSTVIGIDLGTTYSCVAYADETGNPVVAKNLEGEDTTPSVVHFDEADPTHWDAGQVAKDNAIIEPSTTAQLAKRFMGQESVLLTVGGRDYSPEEISALILKKVANDARLTMPMPFEGCVITVPAYFGDAERSATKRAAEIAGLNLYSLVQEPVAAAISYGFGRSTEDETVLVYDLGGGTFDVSIIQVEHADTAEEDGKITVVCNDGDRYLGGSEWDAEVVSYLQNQFVELTGFDGDFDAYAMQALTIEAEKAKKQLSSKPSTSVVLNFTGKPTKIVLSRETFDEMTLSALERTVDTTKIALDNAKEKGYEPTKILLVGGSSYMPQVKEKLSAEFPSLAIELNEPNEAVAKGAAIFALQEARMKHKDDPVPEPEFTREGDSSECGPEPVRDVWTLAGSAHLTVQIVTSKSYGVKATQSSTGKELIFNLIKKNAPIDSETDVYSSTMEFGKHSAGQQSVSIEVFENDEEAESTPIDRDSLGTAEIDLSGMNLPAGSPIQVTFSLSAEGLLDVLAIEPSSGHQCSLQLKVKNAMSQKEVEEARKNLDSLVRND